MKFAHVRSFTISCSLALTGALATGCPSELDEPGNDGTEGADSTGAATTANTNGMTGPVATTGPVTTTTGPGADTTAGMDSVGFVSAGSTDDGSMPLPNGGQCSTDDNCESGFCYQVPMIGGICSECLMDADCGMGTCGLDLTLLYAVCGDGSLGSMCDSNEGCTGDLTCELVIDTGGLFDITTCSECGPASACTDPMQVCAPVYDLAAISGHLGCVDPGSVPDGGGCAWDPVTSTGDGEPCMSGICSAANVLGFVDLGVCGECASDMDCMGMTTCQAATADMTGVIPSMCI